MKASTRSEAAPTVRRPIDRTPLQTERNTFLTIQAAVHAGVAEKHCVFEVTAAAPPEGLLYGVLGGTNRLTREIQTFALDTNSLDHLGSFLDQPTLDLIAEFRFTGNVYGLREGDIYVEGTPVLTIETTYVGGLLLEGFILSMVNFDSAALTAAHHLRQRVPNSRLYAIGRTQLHEEAAETFSRAAAIAGFEAISDSAALKANPSIGAFGGLHPSLNAVVNDDETLLETLGEVFDNLVTVTITSTTPEDVQAEVTTIIESLGVDLFALRLPYGENVVELANAAREALDEQESQGTNLILSGNVPQVELEEMAAEGVFDSYALTPTSIYGDLPRTAGFTFDLVAIQDETYGEFRPVVSATQPGGKKILHRAYDDDWKLEREYRIADRRYKNNREWVRPAIVYIQRGKLAVLPTIDDIRETVADIPATAPQQVVETEFIPEPGADNLGDTEEVIETDA